MSIDTPAPGTRSGAASATLVIRDRPSGRRPTLANARPGRRTVSKLGAGDTIGSYRLLALIGEGAVGRVYLAEHIRLGRRVALKMLRPEYSSSSRLVDRFFAEARAVNDIDHENIVRITDFVEGKDHPSFYIMDLLEGRTLEALLDRDLILPTELALDLVDQLLAAVAAAHARGIVHRDLKPANIFLTPRETTGFDLRLLDFGIAKLVNTSEETKRTEVGALLGTPDYMSPEATLGRPLDHRADLYGVGVLLYEMLVGARPFVAESIPEMFKLHQEAPPPPPSEAWRVDRRISAPLEVVVLALLAKRPEERPESAELVREELLAIRRRLAPPRSSKVAVVAASVAVAVLAAGAGLWFTRTPPPAPAIVEVVEAAPEVQLAVTSTPPDAELLVDGAPIGRTPLRWNVEPSALPLEVEVRRDGYVAARHVLTAQSTLTHVALLPSSLEVKQKNDVVRSSPPIPQATVRPAPPRRVVAPEAVPPPEPIRRSKTLNPFAD